MSREGTITIRCDDCNAAAYYAPLMQASSMEDVLTRLGWRHDRGSDYCPNCKSQAERAPKKI